MKITVIKTNFCLVLMVGLLIIAFVTKDPVNSKLLASLGIITGAFANKILSGVSKSDK